MTLPSSERGVLRDEPSDHLPRRKAPKELSRAAKALKERNRNAQAPKRLAEPQLELKPRGPRGDELHKSTDKLNDILQFLNRADTSIDLDRSGSSRESGGGRCASVGASPGAAGLPLPPSSLQASAVALGTKGEEAAGLRDKSDARDGFSSLGILDADEGENQSAAIRSVCTGVLNKIKGLHDRIQAQTNVMEDLEREVREGKEREKSLEADFLGRITRALDKQGKDHELSLKRHLTFIDRILKDKDLLSKKCENLARELKTLEEVYNKKIDRLQSQWALELKKQKEVWQSSEKAKREAWLSEKTKEIKELTIKCLEPEIQRLIQKSKADLEDLESKHALDTRKKVEECKDYYESYIHSLRDQWRREKDDLIEHERATASNRLREQGDRSDSQIESMRMRLASDFESKLAALENLKGEEHTRHENAMMRLRQESASEIEKVKKECKERVLLTDRSNDKEKERMREKFETEKEGWRQMIVKKIGEEYQQKEEEIAARMQEEKHSELELIVTKLEQETQMMREKHLRDVEKKQQELQRKHAEEVNELKKSNHSFSEKYRNAALASQNTQKEVASMQSLNKASTRELEVKAETISFLENQLAACRKEAVAKEEDIRAMYNDKVGILTQKAASLSEKAESFEKLFEEASSEVSRLKAKSSREMLEVETRVKDAITKREHIISHLRDELHSLSLELEQTENLLQDRSSK